MSKKNTRGETKKLANLPRDVLYAKDTTADIEDKVAQGILNALDKLKKTSVDRRLAKLTGTSALRYRTELSYEVHFRGLTKFFKLIGDYESLLMLKGQMSCKLSIDEGRIPCNVCMVEMQCIK